MEKIDLNKYLMREKEIDIIKEALHNINNDKSNPLLKKGIYIYGNSGTGKTTLISNLLKELNYDIVKYDAGDVRNANIIEDITQYSMSSNNIMSLFNKTKQNIAIMMDEIDGMNTGDKGGINTLIKLIRPKKTKKQKTETCCSTPIICIGNHKLDKKIKELMKACVTIEIKTPTHSQMMTILSHLFPEATNSIKEMISNFVEGDLRKVNLLYKIYKKNNNVLTETFITNILQGKKYNNETKVIVKNIMSNSYTINQHNFVMNENDRTSVGLLWHENIIDMINSVDKNDAIPFYLKQLDNITFSDYIDRITFQNQIWQFNEMSSLIKTLNNSFLYNEFKSQLLLQNKKGDTRFTKVLTKYSTEYNNQLFIQKLCLILGLDKYDLMFFFINMKNSYIDESIIYNLLESYDINKLDINRIFRYIDKYIHDDAFINETSEEMVDDNI